MPRYQEVLFRGYFEGGCFCAVPLAPFSQSHHRVPLSDAAMAVVDALLRIDGNPFVLPGARDDRPLSKMALLQRMRGMEYGVDGSRGNYVPHGFRSSFRDWSSEVSSFPRDVAEMALTHVFPPNAEAMEANNGYSGFVLSRLWSPLSST